jgi:O-antigen ligase
MKGLRDFLLLLLPISLLLGERAVFRLAGVPIYIFELCLVFATLLSWSEVRSGWPRLLQLPLAVRIGSLLLIPALAVSVMVADNRTEALGAAKAWFVLPLLFALVLYLAEVRTMSLVYGIVIHAVAQTWYGFELLPAQEVPRLMGTFASPNFYAAVVAPALFFVPILPVGRLRWLVGIVLVGGLLASQSLGGLLGVIGGGVAVLLTSTPSKKVRTALLLAGLTVTLVVGALGYQRFADNSRSSLSSRFEIWHVATELVREHPITGVGLRSFDMEYLRTVNTYYGAPLEYNVPEPHNLYLAFWLDLSLLGLVAMLLVAVGTVWRGGYAAIPVIVILTHGLVDTPIFKLELAVLFWLYCAFAWLNRGRPLRHLIG